MTQMQSSGEERVFKSGAIRDGGKKPMLQLISPHALMRLGEWLRFACQDRHPKPYPPRNWEQGLPFSDTVGAMERHIQKFKMGLRDEDHIAAILFGGMVLAHQEHEIAAGRMDPALDDMPHYEDRPRPWLAMDPGQDQDYSICQIFRPRTSFEVVCPECGNAWLRSQSYETGIELHCEECGWNSLVVDDRQTFYICGPMRGLPFLNFPAFDGAKKLGESLGHRIISPADMDRARGIDPINDPVSVERALEENPNLVHDVAERDVGVIFSLIKDRGDGLALLPGWQQSVGGMAEVRLTYWLGLKFVDACNWKPIRIETALGIYK